MCTCERHETDCSIIKHAKTSFSSQIYVAKISSYVYVVTYGASSDRSFQSIRYMCISLSIISFDNGQSKNTLKLFIFRSLRLLKTSKQLYLYNQMYNISPTTQTMLYTDCLKYQTVCSSRRCIITFNFFIQWFLLSYAVHFVIFKLYVSIKLISSCDKNKCRQETLVHIIY